MSTMTGMSWTAEGDTPLAGAGGQAAGAAEPTQPAAASRLPGNQSAGLARRTGVRNTIWLLEHAQDAVTVAVGTVLIVLAVVLLIAGIVDFASSKDSMEVAGQDLLDQILLVLILLEIVHTVVLTLRAHRLVAQPFIVVGLIAVVRRILLVLNPESLVSKNTSTSELALLIGMVAVFVAGLVVVSLFEKSDE